MDNYARREVDREGGDPGGQVVSGRPRSASTRSRSGAMPSHDVRVGCAGWSIPKEHAGRFPEEGSHLTRYAQRLPAVEVNSSFYRPHRPSTYARWAAETPQGFAFALKVPREVTHRRRLLAAEEPLDRFLAETAALGSKRGPLLVQLPPSLAFDAGTVTAFFTALQRSCTGPVACEPRHTRWFVPEDRAALMQGMAAGDNFERDSLHCFLHWMQATCRKSLCYLVCPAGLEPATFSSGGGPARPRRI